MHIAVAKNEAAGDLDAVEVRGNLNFCRVNGNEGIEPVGPGRRDGESATPAVSLDGELPYPEGGTTEAFA